MLHLNLWDRASFTPIDGLIGADVAKRLAALILSDGSQMRSFWQAQHKSC